MCNKNFAKQVRNKLHIIIVKPAITDMIRVMAKNNFQYQNITNVERISAKK